MTDRHQASIGMVQSSAKADWRPLQLELELHDASGNPACNQNGAACNLPTAYQPTGPDNDGPKSAPPSTTAPEKRSEAVIPPPTPSLGVDRSAYAADGLPGASRALAEAIQDSPFLDFSSPMTMYEWAKVPLMAPFLAVRMLLFLVCFPLVWAVVRAFTLGTDPHQPLPAWRYAIVKPFTSFWAGILLCIGFNFWGTVTGQEHIRPAEAAGAIIVFNHVSYIDAAVLGSIFVPSGVIKASVARMPLFGVFMRAMQFTFIRRRTDDGAPGRAGARGHARPGTTRLIHERAADPRYPMQALAPEGTTKAAPCLLQFYTGAFCYGTPVLPVLIKYYSRHFNPGWGRVQSTLWHFLRIQFQFLNFVDVEILPPYKPSSAEAANPQLYAENVRALMAERLGVPLSAHSLEEQALLKKHGVCVDWTGRHLVIGGQQVDKA